LVVGEAAEAVELLTLAVSLQPALILLEWGLPGERSDELVTQLKALPSPATVIVLCAEPGLEQVARLAGADGFVSQTDGPARLLTVLQQAFAPTPGICLFSNV
jgi:DNA-binding NarL/FixJ family response regulator